MALELRDRIALALGAGAVIIIGAAAWLLLASPASTAVSGPSSTLDLLLSIAPSPTLTSTDLVVDVEGGVARPGVVLLPAESRVADAIRAAGGYAPDADLAAAASSLNLAARLSDGAQVYVPVAGLAAPPGADVGGSNAGGLVNLNTASADELEGLPGIGPVTAQKILAARGEQPFETLDELVDRKVMNRGQLDDIRDLVTL